MRDREEIDISEFPNLKIFHEKMSEVPEWAREMIGKMLSELERCRRHKIWRERAEKILMHIQWGGQSGDYCPICGKSALEQPERKHRPDCELAALIGEGKQ